MRGRGGCIISTWKTAEVAISGACRPLSPLKPYWYHIFLSVYLPLGLYLDVHCSSVNQQYVLGVITWVMLWVVTRPSSPFERRQVWLMVGIATCAELFCSLLWGLYRYRFGNVPLFVPPGHGMIYLFALRFARTPLAINYRQIVIRGAIVAATLCAIGGLTLEPLLIGRWDLGGAMLLPYFLFFMTRRNGAIYAGAFLATSGLELFGTSFGNWTWQVIAPVTHVPMGNPPSVIAGAYCIMDYAATNWAVLLPAGALLPRLLAFLRVASPRAIEVEA